MNFIKINLNQTVSKAQKDFIKQEQKRWYIFSFVCVLFVSTIIWLFFINSRMQYVIDERNNTNLYKVESKRIFWTEKLIALSKITPDDMAITKIEFKGKKLYISAISNIGSGEKEFTVVENFMKKIDLNNEFNKDFKDIKFDFLDKEKTKNDELLKFKVEAKLR